MQYLGVDGVANSLEQLRDSVKQGRFDLGQLVQQSCHASGDAHRCAVRHEGMKLRRLTVACQPTDHTRNNNHHVTVRLSLAGIGGRSKHYAYVYGESGSPLNSSLSVNVWIVSASTLIPKRPLNSWTEPD